MDPLHKSYSNTRTWKFQHMDGNEVLRFDATGNKISSTLVSLICIVLGCVCFYFIEEKLGWMILAISCATSVLVSAIGMYVRKTEEKKPDLLIYRPASGEVKFPREGKIIPNAQSVLSFSHERHEGGKYGAYELNYVIDNERLPFLKSINSFRKITRNLERMGFSVTYFDAFDRNSNKTE